MHDRYEDWTVEQLIAALKTLPPDMRFVVRLPGMAAPDQQAQQDAILLSEGDEKHAPKIEGASGGQ